MMIKRRRRRKETEGWPGGNKARGWDKRRARGGIGR
jgi:hypothetical protein